MRGLFNFWAWVGEGALDLLVTYWYVPVAYGVLYVIGAAVFLLTIRVGRNGSSQLVINRHSLHYAVAHPYLYGKLKGIEQAEARDRAFWRDTGMNPPLYLGPAPLNICPYFARLFNMLLFVWPILVLYFLVTTVVGTFGGLLISGNIVHPDLQGDNFLATPEVHAGKYRFRAIVVIGPVLLLIGLGFYRATLWMVLKAIGTVLLYALPVVLVIVIIVFVIWRVRSDKDTTALITERFGAFKDRVCKQAVVE